MEVVYRNCAGMDVHKRFVVICHRQLDEHGQVHQETRRFGTMSEEIEGLARWLVARGCTHVAMESTGVYWLPLYNLLEGQVEVWLVNAKHVHHVPGRKSDQSDAAWLAQLMQYGLLKASFIPARAQRELRDLVRYRQSLVEERTRITNRIQKVLEDANLKLSSVVTDMQGASAQAILQHLLAGERDPHVLAELARGRLRSKRSELARALRGQVTDHHCFLVARLLAHLEFLDEELAALEAEAEARVQQMPPFADVVERLVSVPGINRLSAITIIAEIGTDMSRFPTAGHLASWAGLVPGQNETGGKARPSKTRPGNHHVRRIMIQVARAAARTRNTYFKALYHRLAARRGKGRAAVAVARSLLQVVYHLIQRGTTYQELGADHFDRLDRAYTTRRLVKRLEGLGYQVNLTEPAGAAA